MVANSVRFAPADSFTTAPPSENRHASMRIPKNLLNQSSSSSFRGDVRENSTSHPAVTGSVRPSLATANNFGGASSMSAAVRKSNQLQQNAIAANDGPSLAAALAQSIRHHARCIDGEHAKAGVTVEAMGMAAGVKGGGKVVIPADYDDEEDQVSLAPTVELNFEKEAALARREEGLGGGRNGVLSGELRDYVANTAGEDEGNVKNGGKKDTHSGRDGGRKDIYQSNNMNDRSSNFRNRFNIANWFRGKGVSDRSTVIDDMTEAQTQAEDTVAAIAKAIASGDVNQDKSHLYTGNIWNAGPSMGRTPTFVAPPPTSFRVATRHPSHHTPLGSDGSGSFGRGRVETQAMARKRQRRHDSFLRLMVAIVCFGASLTFALMYGDGKFGLALTSAAYERKIVAGQYDDMMAKGEHGLTAAEALIFYPEWWEDEKGIPDMTAREVNLSPIVEHNVAEVDAPRTSGRVETPFFWLVPRSGANVVRTIMSFCLKFVEASELGAGRDEDILLVEEDDGKRFVNVDMSTSEGLERAKQLNIASSGVPDVVISTVLHDVLDVFNEENKARAFVILRHPLDRAVSKYYSDLISDPDVTGMTLVQYIRSGGARVENNYLTRFLTGQYGGALGVHHLDIAREILRRKFVIGLASDLQGTVRILDYVYQWNNHTATTGGVSSGASDSYSCYDEIFSALSDKSPPAVEEGSEGWKLLVAQNWLDLKVYEYAEFLFKQQLELIQ